MPIVLYVVQYTLFQLQHGALSRFNIKVNSQKLTIVPENVPESIKIGLTVAHDIGPLLSQIIIRPLENLEFMVNPQKLKQRSLDPGSKVILDKKVQ